MPDYQTLNETAKALLFALYVSGIFEFPHILSHCPTLNVKPSLLRVTLITSFSFRSFVTIDFRRPVENRFPRMVLLHSFRLLQFKAGRAVSSYHVVGTTRTEKTVDDRTGGTRPARAKTRKGGKSEPFRSRNTIISLACRCPGGRCAREGFTNGEN